MSQDLILDIYGFKFLILVFFQEQGKEFKQIEIFFGGFLFYVFCFVLVGLLGFSYYVEVRLGGVQWFLKVWEVYLNILFFKDRQINGI